MLIGMSLHPAVVERLGRLAPDQRGAATAEPGPVLCVAPAGSGKTTTLVARIAWLVATGVEPATICAVTFNRRAAEELGGRLDAALAPLGLEPGTVRVRTFHALGREILRDGGRSVEPLLDRATVIRELAGDLSPAAMRRLDDGFSRLKLDAAVDTAALREETAGAVGRGEACPPIVDAFLRYEAALAERGGLDFDDLVRHALRALRDDERLLERWRGRCAHLLVDEVQDVDRSQLALALTLAAPANRIFLVGDDDQTIYAWRLADVRRVLGLAAELRGLKRVDLVTNYRCPAAVVERSVRLVECNRERFAKTIRAGPGAIGRLHLVPDPGDDVARARRLLADWPAGDGEVRAVLARTNAELAPYAAVALEMRIPYRAADDGLLLDDADLEPVLDALAGMAPETAGGDPARGPLLPVLAALLGIARADPGADERVRRGGAGATEARDWLDGAGNTGVSLHTAVLGWAAAYREASSFVEAVREARRRRSELQRDDAPLVLATAHGTKGLEFDHVAVVNLDEGRFPSARSLAESDDPERVLEEERRLAYVAWTRARKSLALVYDPGAPSPFLREAFDADELRA